MKQSNTPSASTPGAVQATLLSAGVRASDEQCAMMLRHAALMLEANKSVNLTRITDPDDVIALHIVDSLAFLPHVEPLSGSVLDIGSGAGFPGIPLAVMGYDVTLCESVGKKAAFLESCCDQLGIDARVVRGRAEDLAAAEPQAYDVVVARAVSSLPALVELASPLLRLGGRLIALKGAPEEAEIEQAVRAARECGMRYGSASRYSLRDVEQRAVFMYEKEAAPRRSLPRRPGLAQRQPLG